VSQWKIALVRGLIQPTINWFHSVLGHPGQKRLHWTIKQRFHHSQLRKFCDTYKCDGCERYKLEGRGYGLLPERSVTLAPWEEVALDLIGPWTIQILGTVYEFYALTCIDTVSNLVELIRCDHKTAPHVRRKFEQAWLSRYPWPRRCIHDNGGEFTGFAFQRLLTSLNIKDVPTTSYNPQANSICERMHQTVGNVLRTILHTNPPTDIEQAKDIVDDALATAMHAMRVTVSTTLNTTPGALVFNRDMLLNVPLVADWHQLHSRREHLVQESLRRQNAKRRAFDYVIGMQVFKKIISPTKLGPRVKGPFTIQQVHANGTITIVLCPGVTERINIRRVIPKQS